jgi:hypothetical protein
MDAEAGTDEGVGGTVEAVAEGSAGNVGKGLEDEAIGVAIFLGEAIIRRAGDDAGALSSIVFGSFT